MKTAAALVSVASGHPTFQEWAADYGFNGANQPMEAIYNANLAIIDALNAENNGARFAVNQFSGLSVEEFVSTYLTYDASQSVLNSTGLPVREVHYLESAVGDKEWTVSPVKNQGSCGSCWAFGAVAGIEAEAIITHGRSDILSEQQIMDCTSSNACNGGRADSAYNSIKGKDLFTEASYPYKAKNGQCTSGSASGLKLTGFNKVGGSLNDASLTSALDSHPQVIAVAATPWQSYKSGVFSGSTACSGLNHQVFATAYNSEYIKIKNSWGTGWGESGYIRIARSTAGCGTSGWGQDSAFYPTLSASAPPAPTPAPSPGPSGSHYDRPPCQADEEESEFDTDGSKICAAPCSKDADCPTDTPGGTAVGKCNLVDSDDSSKKYCGLACGTTAGTCPAGSTCVGNIPLVQAGTCTWPSSSARGKFKHLKPLYQTPDTVTV